MSKGPWPRPYSPDAHDAGYKRIRGFKSNAHPEQHYCRRCNIPVHEHDDLCGPCDDADHDARAEKADQHQPPSHPNE